MTTPPAVLAVIGVVTSAVCASGIVGWLGTARVLARLDPGPDRPRAVPAVARRAIQRAGLHTDPRTALEIWAGGVALTAAAATVTRAALIPFVLTILSPPLGVVALRGRASRLRARQLPAVLDGITAGLRGGSSLRDAIADVGEHGGPLGVELIAIARDASGGRRLADVLADWTAAAPDAPSRIAGAALLVAADVGGPGADAIEAAADGLRERAAADDEVDALSVQARLSAVVLTAAPVVFAVLLTAVDPSSSRFLLTTPAGWACLAIGLGLDVVGATWMARLVRVAR